MFATPPNRDIAPKRRSLAGLQQDAQKGQRSHPPDPGAPRRALSQAPPHINPSSGVAGMIPTACVHQAPFDLSAVLRAGGLAASDCARHHPLQSETQRVPGTPSTSFTQGGGRLGWPSLRASTEHSIRLGPERINPECAVREHNGQPCRPVPLSCVRDARAREAAWPPHARSCMRGARTSGASQPPRSPFSASYLRVEFVQHTWERNGFPDVVQTTDPGYNPFDSHPEAGMGDGSIPPKIHIPPERLFGKFMFLNASQ